MNDVVLVHHGIKGQKWGVQNGPPYPLGVSQKSSAEKKAKRTDGKVSQGQQNRHRPTLRDDFYKSQQRYEKDLKEADKKFRLTPEQKEKYAKVMIGTAAVIGVGAAIYFGYKHTSIMQMAKLAQSDALSSEAAKEVMLQTLDDGDQILKQGDVLRRMSAYANVDYAKATKPLYTAFKDEDVTSYMIRLKDWSGTGKRYEVALKALKDLRIPSEQNARQMFDEHMASDPVYMQKLLKTVTDAYTELGMTPSAATMKASLEIANDPFKVAMYSIVKDKEDTAMWVGRLRAAGYDAIIDYFDKGTLADQPLIVLDPSATLQKTGEQFVTQQFKLDALANLKAKGVTEMPGSSLSVDTVRQWVEAGLF